MEFDLPFSRSEILKGGLQGRRATSLVSLIEHRTDYLMAQVGEAINILLDREREAGLGGGGLLQLRQQSTEGITIDELERYASQWASLIPADANVQAMVAHLLAQKYSFVYEALPAIRQALALDSPEVKQAYESQYHKPLTNLFRVEQALEGQKEGKQTHSEIRPTRIGPNQGQSVVLASLQLPIGHF